LEGAGRFTRSGLTSGGLTGKIIYIVVKRFHSLRCSSMWVVADLVSFLLIRESLRFGGGFLVF
jgi:hypothetical protein